MKLLLLVRVIYVIITKYEIFLISLSSAYLKIYSENSWEFGFISKDFETERKMI